MLQIVDAQNLITEERSMDSFLRGFKLARELAYERNCFETDGHSFPAEEAERNAWFLWGQDFNPLWTYYNFSSLIFSNLI